MARGTFLGSVAMALLFVAGATPASAGTTTELLKRLHEKGILTDEEYAQLAKEDAAAPAAAAPPPPKAAAQPPTATPAAAAPAPVPAPAPAATAASTETQAAPVRSFGELSPEARAQLPPVSVSGSTYSKNPALRMLIINGKVIQEGQEIAPGFKLETIGQRSAVLNHQGLRYSIGY